MSERLDSKRKEKPKVAILQGEKSLLDSEYGSSVIKPFVPIGYGLTETSPTTHLLPVAYAVSKMGSAGTLLPNLEARLVVDGDGKGDVEAPEGEPGELWVRGPIIMKVGFSLRCFFLVETNITCQGYLNNPAATKDAITEDGWFKTGDIVRVDTEGFYYVIDRRKELIKYKVGWCDLHAFCLVKYILCARVSKFLQQN